MPKEAGYFLAGGIMQRLMASWLLELMQFALFVKLSPLAASKRPAGALSPTDVALFPTSPCTAECCLKEASHTPGALPSGGCPGNPICGLSARSAAPC